MHSRAGGWWGDLYPLGPPPWAEKTTVAGAQAKAGYRVPVPSDPAASDATLTQIWVAPQNDRQVALVFDNGKVQILMHPATPERDLHFIRSFVAEKDKNTVTSTIGQVNGQPALVITPNTDALTHSNPAAVTFNLNGVSVSISSHTYRTDTLLAIAESMH